MEFTLNNRQLKYEDEKFFIKLEKNWNHFDKGQLIQLTIMNDKYGYQYLNIGNKKYKIHRILGFLFLGLDIDDKIQFIDHINRNKSDNRLENLRIVNCQQNGFNRNSKGYYFHKKNKKYQSNIYINKEKIYLGEFNTEEEARQAYLDAKQIYHQI